MDKVECHNGGDGQHTRNHRRDFADEFVELGVFDVDALVIVSNIRVAGSGSIALLLCRKEG
jgi:hypothetical protein